MQLQTFCRRGRLFCGLLLCVLLTGCDLLPSISLGQSPQTPTPSINVWNTVSTGVEMRQEVWKSPDDPNTSDTVVIARFDMRYVNLSVAYQPDQPLSMDDWIKKEQPVALLNGGFFDGLDQATALVVSNGQAYGTSYQGFGGMLDVNAQGQVELRSLHDQPYDPSENLTQATQCEPMLMLNGQRTQFTADSKASPRSVAALDNQGRLLFIVSSGISFTLDEMATLLAQSDLGLVTALNLDGGSSTGMYINAGSQSVTIDAFTNLPIMIVIKKK